MTRKALAALVEKLRKRVEGVTIKEGWIKGARPRWCREIDWCREELEAALALPADAPLEELSDREIREWLWKNHGHIALYGDDGEMQCPECNPWDYKRAPLLDVVRAAFAAVRAYTPTLTAEDREQIAKSLWNYEREDTAQREGKSANYYAEWPADAQRQLYCRSTYRQADMVIEIIAAKSQKGGI